MRQGCALAPLLFVLAVDALTTCTTLACSQAVLGGFQTQSASAGIPLLQFAVDTTFFIEGLMEEARNLYALLELFADFSELQINCAKSALVGFGLTHEEGLQCSEALGTSIGSAFEEGQDNEIRLGPVIEKVER